MKNENSDPADQSDQNESQDKNAGNIFSDGQDGEYSSAAWGEFVIRCFTRVW